MGKKDVKIVTYCASLLLLFGVFMIFATPGRTEGEEKFDPLAAVKGQASFKTYCGSCHGIGGKGHGPLAPDLRIAPADLTQLSKENDGKFPFEMVYKSIDGRQEVKGHGSTDMPVWGDAFKTTDTEELLQGRINELTQFVWSIQEKSEE